MISRQSIPPAFALRASVKSRHSASRAGGFLVVLALATPVAAQTIESTRPGAAINQPGSGSAAPGLTIAGLIGPGTLAEQDRAREAADREREAKDREREAQERAREREYSLYERGMDAIWDHRWDRAVDPFSRLAELRGTKSDAALYWKSYAQNRLGQRAEALATLSDLLKSYPSSSYLKQARALELELRSSAGQTARPEAQGDEDLKMLALNALAHSNAQEAVPAIENVLNGSGTPQLKSKALFVLAQINSPRAREVLRGVAKGSSIPELQGRAIQYLGTQGGAESRAMLAEIYASSTDVDVKRRILRAFMSAGERDRLFTAASSETNPELRKEAIRQLGAMGANESLWQMYQKETNVDLKRQIISALQVSGNATRMIEIAKTEKDAELRRAAVRNLGIMGSKASGDALIELYAVEKEPAIRSTIVNALFTQGNATGLVALARKEQDINMKKEIVQRLANMGNNPVAKQYMLELLK
jgi:HEAT repeat protein